MGLEKGRGDLRMGLLAAIALGDPDFDTLNTARRRKRVPMP